MTETITGGDALSGPDMGRKNTRSLLKVGPVRRLHPSYSIIVRLLKVVFPVIAISLVVLVIAWPYLQKDVLQFSIGFSSEEAISEDEPSMINPRYTGVDNNRLPFSITADIARNLLLDTTRVELDMPKADVTMSDGSWLLITAEQGVYGRSAQVLDLSGAVNLFHDRGYEIKTEAVHINLLSNTAESVVPVQGHGPIGDLKSEGFRMNNNKQIIYFTGKSSLLLYPDVLGNNGEN